LIATTASGVSDTNFRSHINVMCNRQGTAFRDTDFDRAIKILCSNSEIVRTTNNESSQVYHSLPADIRQEESYIPHQDPKISDQLRDKRQVVLNHVHEQYIILQNSCQDPNISDILRAKHLGPGPSGTFNSVGAERN
jgi:hypothetical protein